MRGTVSATLPEEAYGAALTRIGGIGPRRLRALLAEAPASRIWAELLAGRGEEDCRERAAGIDLPSFWEAHRANGIEVRLLGRPGYPQVLAEDPEAPAVLFAVGDLGLLDRFPRVAVVGTRSATRYGLGVAAQIGADLAAAGVSVVSGLAPGIDGAVHEGAVAGWTAAGLGGGPPVGVVAGGLDGPRPRQQARLWERVAEAGVVISEAPAGAPALPWRFPQRNRIVAALAEVVVVVESHPQGGSLHTVQAAIRRGVTVGAVPGSVRSPASAGTNDLLADGCFVVRDAADVLVAIGLARAGEIPVRRRRERLPAPRADGPAAMVLDSVDWEPSSLEQLLSRSGLPIEVVSAALEQLRGDGLVHGEGGWWERA
ncbi:MAG TPA: DNA-processing protein DprA [Acidimicrobiales bacterium]|nr:DNA-processing protein DprA [Acidimicrobiales bacterium]